MSVTTPEYLVGASRCMGGQMSETRQEPDWWMAADGKWYPPASHPSNWGGVNLPEGLPTPPEPPTVAVAPTAATAQPRTNIESGSTHGAATLDQPRVDQDRISRIERERWAEQGPNSVLTSLVILVGSLGAVVAVIAFFGAIGPFDPLNQVFDPSLGASATRRAEQNLVDAESLMVGTSFAVVVAWALFTVFLIIWLNRAYRTIETTQAPYRNWSRGWAVGGFFIPFANLFLPFLVTNEVWKIASNSRTASQLARWKQGSTNPYIVLWWLGLVASIGFNVAAAVAYARAVEAITIAQSLYNQAYGFTAASAAAYLVAFASASYMAYEIRRELRPQQLPSTQQSGSDL